MSRLLNQLEFKRILGVKTLGAAKRKLADIGIKPKKMGRDLYITERQLLAAIEGRDIVDEDNEFRPNLAGI